MNKFSVLISIYYKESPIYFREALDSVFAQTLLPAEIVLVKDGPLTPELDAIIEEYAARHPIFKIVTNETNLGLGRALAKGLLACSYEYVARMDTDDLIAPTRFEKEIRKLDEGYDVEVVGPRFSKGMYRMSYVYVHARNSMTILSDWPNDVLRSITPAPFSGNQPF